MLEVRNREQVPLDWATTQTNVGNALLALGKGSGGLKYLEQAVAAYRAVLEVYKREQVPLDWAIQTNLGDALWALRCAPATRRRSIGKQHRPVWTGF